ncbi:MAG: hypothetical protein AAGJ35_15920 [Myxococcota bacterium]
MIENQTESKMRKVSFFGREIEVDYNQSVEEIKSALTTMFPQLENSTSEVDPEGNVKFVVRAGTKG